MTTTAIVKQNQKHLFPSILTHWDYLLFGFCLFASNRHLFMNSSITDVIFLPKAVVQGEFLRLITFTFAHVSWYHLLLDASAFFILYATLKAEKRGFPFFYTCVCSAFGLLAPLVFDTTIETIGLCGLSAVGHGLFAVVSLKMITSKKNNPKNRTIGILLLTGLSLKCILEVLTNGSVSSIFHFNLMGTPVYISHIGGVFGGVISFLILNRDLISIRLKYSVSIVKQFFTTAVFCLFFLLVTLHTPGEAAYHKRSALVIGNSSYNTAALRNPANDAVDMAEALEKFGFNVILQTNVNRRSFDRAIRDFGKSIQKGGVGLFFYAGHAVQISGTNYLIPTDAQIIDETDIPYESVPADRVLSVMNKANNTMNIVILDACRDNPFKRNYRSPINRLTAQSQASLSVLPPRILLESVLEKF